MQYLQMRGNTDVGKYWIGAECREAPPELVAQLGLKEGEGLVVVRLLDDSPAAKAGLKQHDVLLSIGDTKLSHLPELIKAVNAAEGKELSLKIVRAGKEQTIAVTPAERPQDNLRVIARPGPGMMFGSGNVERLKIPDNVSITVTRQGTNPPKVTISRGDEKWEVNKPDELEKLPEELRPIAQGLMAPPTRVLSGGLNGPTVQFGPMQFSGEPNLQQMLGNLMQNNGQSGDWQGPPGDRQGPPGDRQGPPGDRQGPPGGPRNFSGPGQIPPELMQRLDQLDRQLQMLQDQIRSLRDGGQQGRARGDNPPPQDGQRQGPDGDRRGPPGNGGRRGPPDGNRQGPPPEGDRGGPPQDGPR